MVTELCNEELSTMLNHHYCRSERKTEGTTGFLNVNVTTVITTT